MRSLVLYAFAGVLVVAYVNTFTVWRFLQHQLGGDAGWIPWLLVALFAAGAALQWRRRLAGRPVSPTMLAAALLVGLAGMLLTDPEFPAKRVHVPQYALLAAIVWLALRPHVGSDRVALMSLLVGGLFGVHDEFLQGLHPARTFGIRDMAINLCGVAAGTLVAAGLSGQTFALFRTIRLPAGIIAGGAMATTGLLIYVYAVAGLPAGTVPYWTALPMLAGSFALATAVMPPDVGNDLRHAGAVVVLLLVALAAYPVIVNETSLHFA